MRAILLCMVLGGCGFRSTATNGDDSQAPLDSATTDAASDGSGGGPGDGAIDCWKHWFDGDSALQISTPQELTMLSSTGEERDAWLSGDGLRLYFARNPGAKGMSDVYFASRTSTTQAFSSPATVDNLDTNDQEGRVSLTADEKLLVLSGNHSTPAGKFQIFITTRNDTRTPFGSPNQDHLAMVNAANANHYDPFLTTDGLRLYLAPAPEGMPPQQIAVATRTAANQDFTMPAVLPVINSGSGDADPALFQDERIILFSSRRPGGAGSGDLYYATRSDPKLNFNPPVPIPFVNDATDDGDPFLSADGCELYFSSRRNAGRFHLFSARVTK